MKKFLLLLLPLAVIAGCSSESSPPAPKPEPPQLLSGRSAFQQLYISARSWAPDARPYRLQSATAGDNKGQTLPEKNVVRELTRLGAWRGAPTGFHLPAAGEDGLKTVVLVQARHGGRILGVGQPKGRTD